MSDDQRCVNCLHFRAYADGSGWCDLLDQDPDGRKDLDLPARATGLDDTGGLSIDRPAEFGCTLFEPKESKP